MLPSEQMEKDILRSVRDNGPMWGDNESLAEYAKELCDRYTEHGGQMVTVIIASMCNDGLLYPITDTEGKFDPANGARGVTLRGLQRLDRLEHRWRYWGQENWFPLAVAFATAGVGVANILLAIFKVI